MLINVTKSSMPPYNEYCEKIKELWDSRWLTNNGKNHRELQDELKRFLGVSCIDLTSNGHMALELSLSLLGLKGEVITTPFTFASTTHAIVRAGLKPVFCDINPHSFTIDVNKIEQLINENTCAIMPVHVYGNICDVESIDTLAKKYGLKVIYDAAHAFGCKYNGKGIAAYGDASCFSFHATKVFHTIEGGAICFSNEHLKDKIFEMKDFGIHDEETVRFVGTNAKMNEFAALMGLCNLKYFDENNKMRKNVYRRYKKNLENVNGIQLNDVQNNVDSNYAYFPITIDEKKFGTGRDEVKDVLNANGIGARKYFYPLTNEFDCYKNTYCSDETPVAHEISKKVLTLPMYAELALGDVDRICEIFLSCKK